MARPKKAFLLISLSLAKHMKSRQRLLHCQPSSLKWQLSSEAEELSDSYTRELKVMKCGPSYGWPRHQYGSNFSAIAFSQVVRSSNIMFCRSYEMLQHLSRTTFFSDVSAIELDILRYQWVQFRRYHQWPSNFLISWVQYCHGDTLNAPSLTVTSPLLFYGWNIDSYLGLSNILNLPP